MPSTANALQTSANIPLELIRESPHNHRKHFDETRLQELAESVKAHGVLQPVLVRPVSSTKVSGFGKAKYELVYGHRRFRAAKLAKLKEIPATVRELDDKAALEVALIENCRREDVLPMEEAEGYQELHEKHKVSVKELAERVGKSEEYVYGRLKLCELKSPAARKALDAGKVSPSLALLIARIPGEKLQEQAAKKILEGGPYSYETGKPEPMSYRRAQEVVQEEFMLQLSKAPFNPKDAELVPEAGACGPCPKRTGNCKALYPDVKSDNVCTDPECFGKKKAAAFKREQEAAKEKGQKLLKESKAIWDWEGKQLGYKGKEKYFELTDKCPGDKKGRTFKELLGDKAPVVLAIDPHGKKHQLLEKEKLQEALAAAGHKLKLKDKQSQAAARNDTWEKQRAEEAFRARVAARLGALIGEHVSSAEALNISLLRILVSQMYERYEYELGDMWRRHAPSGDTAPEVIRQMIDGATSMKLIGLLIEGLCARWLRHTYQGYGPGTKELCAAIGVELKVLEEEQRQADAAAEKAAPAKAGKDSEPEEAQFGDGGED